MGMNPGAYALVTGAGQGLGLALAEECARRGNPLALVDLPAVGLAETAQRLARRHGVRVAHLETDFCAPQGAAVVARWLEQRRIGIRLLINNAGISCHGPFRESPLERYERLLALNVGVVVRLTHRLLPALQRQPQACILNVASLAAFYPLPNKSVYASSKAFVLNFTLALREELRGGTVRASVLCPGGMYTNPEVRERIAALGGLQRCSCQDPAAVARYALRQLDRGRAVIIPGLLNRAVHRVSALLPRPLLRFIILQRSRSGA